MATEKRLIDVTEPLRLFYGWLKQLELPEDEGDKRGVESCISILEDEPTVDAVEVVHGRWEDHKCTNCGGAEPGYYDHIEDCIVYTPTAFCPNCGADMRGGDGNG